MSFNNITRNNLLNELSSTSHTSFLSRSESFWKTITDKKPEVLQKIQEFQKKYHYNIQLIQNKSWIQLKKELGLRMAQSYAKYSLCQKIRIYANTFFNLIKTVAFSTTLFIIRSKSWAQLKNDITSSLLLPDKDTPSLQDFRGIANQFVNELVTIATKALKLPEVTWTAIGNDSYASDVDTSIVYEKGPLSLKDAYTIKSIRETAHTYVFKGLSGVQLDTEGYTPHPAKDETAKKLNYQTYSQQFILSELSMALQQAHVGLQENQKELQEWLKKEADNFQSPQNQRTIKIITEYFDEWHNIMERDIDILMLKKAHYDVEKMSPEAIKATAHKLKKQSPDTHKDTTLNYRTPIMLYLADQAQALTKEITKLENLLKTNPEDKSLQHQRQKLIIKLDTLSKMLNRLLPEGTFGGGEGNVTLYRAEGQQQQSEFKKKDKLKKQQKKQGLPVTYSEEKKREEPTLEELTFAAYEQNTQFLHKILDTNSPIASAKYFYRTIRNKRRAMDLYFTNYPKNQKLPPEFTALYEEIKEAEYKAKNLEKCLRRNYLNREASLSFLKEIFTSSSIATITAIIDRLEDPQLNLPGILKSQKFNALVDELIKYKLLKKEDIIEISSSKNSEIIKKLPKNEKLLKVLQAMVGYYVKEKEKHLELTSLFDDADTITLKKFNLNTADEVQKFKTTIDNLSSQWQKYFFTHINKSPLPPAFWVKNNMNYPEIWNDAKKKIASAGKVKSRG